MPCVSRAKHGGTPAKVGESLSLAGLLPSSYAFHNLNNNTVKPALPESNSCSIHRVLEAESRAVWGVPLCQELPWNNLRFERRVTHGSGPIIELLAAGCYSVEPVFLTRRGPDRRFVIAVGPLARPGQAACVLMFLIGVWQLEGGTST